MDRGPMALFGAILAVGLGPAMWLGAQFGDTTSPPRRPPAVTVQQNQVTEPKGGAGAGDAPADQAEIVRSEPKAKTEPIRNRPRPVAPASSATPEPSETQEPSTGPTGTTTPTDEPSDEPASPPTESTTEPGTPATGDDEDEPSLPPVASEEQAAEEPAAT